MRRHLKILGAVYSLLAVLSVAVALAAWRYAWAGGEKVGAAPLIVIMLALWLLLTGVGLWRRRRWSRPAAAVTAAILLALNSLPLLPGPDKLAPTSERAAFHMAFIAFALYTLIVVLHPRTKAEMI